MPLPMPFPPIPIIDEDLVECGRCERLADYADITVTVRGSNICDLCLGPHYWRCESCDGWNRDGRDCGNNCQDDDDDDDDGGCDCTDCRSMRRDRGGSSLHDYYYKPSPEFHGDGPLYLGPEIEVEVDRHSHFDKCVQHAAARFGDLGYLKRDSSLSNGFEIVTHPMSYAYAMDRFPWGALAELEDMGCYTDSGSTGIHVHVSRDGFSSPCHTYRWMKFIYRNQRDVTALARRESDQWAAFDPDSRADIKHYAKGHRFGNRYQAINPNNDHTFELRMFASSLNPDEVKAAFGFAHASVEYTRQLTYANITKAAGWTWGAFSQWIADRPDYSPLARQMEVYA